MNKHCYADQLSHACDAHAGLPALHIKRGGEYQTWTFADFRRDLNRLTSVLRKHGLGKGKNAAVVGENSPELVIAYHAILLTGACTVPIDPGIPPEEIETIIAITEAEVVFCSPMYERLFLSLRKKHGFLRRIITLGEKSADTELVFSNYLAMGEVGHDAFAGKFSPDDPMVIIFTSGTTGKAKGVVLCQKNFTSVTNSAIPRMRLGPGDRVLAVLPLHHVFGFAAGVAGPLCGGMAVVLVSHINGPLILEALRDKGITMLPAVPKMVGLFYESVLHNVKKKGPLATAAFSAMLGISAALGSAMSQPWRRRLFAGVHRGFGGNLALIISGGATLRKKYRDGFMLMGFNILEGYGLTETFGPITVCPADNPRPASVGPALAENEIKIDEPDKDGVGEVLLRGACVFNGYYKNESLTCNVFDDDRWFRTGDLGRLDADGFLFISGRKKDVIVLDTGKNVYPDELEDYYEQSPLIEEIGVFGVSREEGEIVAAAIVPSPEMRQTNTIASATRLLHDELVRLARRLPVYRRISDFVVVYQPLPRTTTRKLKKQELRGLYASIRRTGGGKALLEEQLSVIETALMETDEYRLVIDTLLAISPRIDRRAVTLRSRLEMDCGLDSLDRVELLTAVEQSAGFMVPDSIFDKIESVGDVVILVKEREADHTPASADRMIGFRERLLDMSYYRSPLPEPESAFRRIAALPLRIAVCLAPGDAVSCEERPDTLKGPMIFAANHPDIPDAFRLLRAIPRSIAENTFFLIEPLPYPRFLSALYRRHGVALANPGDPIERLKASLSICHGEKNLIVFPEGKIGSPGTIEEFKPGIGLLAQDTNATLVPVCIACRSMRFGRSFSWSGLYSRGQLPHDATPRQLADYVRARIVDLQTPGGSRS